MQYSSSQLKTQADNSVKLATDIVALNVWKSESMVALNCKGERNIVKSIKLGIPTNDSLSCKKQEKLHSDCQLNGMLFLMKSQQRH